MLAKVVRFSEYAARPGRYSLLETELPGRGVHTIGVLLLDPAQDELHVRLRRDWSSVGDDEDTEVLAELEDGLHSLARERGGAAVLEYLEGAASLAVRVTDRAEVTVRNFERTLGELYREHVKSTVLEFRTHLPRYSLAAAAGLFLRNSADVEVEVEEWIEMPPGFKLEEGMFVARIQGQSMGSRIPDGSLCVFRRNVVGSRNERLVLVRDAGTFGDDKFSVKKYLSEKVYSEEGFQHTRIQLKSLNPAFPSWDLDKDPERYEIVAEFERVLE